MRFDFIDIGTADFDYTVPKRGESGVHVEPLAIYLDRIPRYPGCLKVNAAIADDDTVTVHYVDPLLLDGDPSLPQWLRGCSSIGIPHPTAAKVLLGRGLDPARHILTAEVEAMTFAELCSRCGITSVGRVKIDAEGHDCHIVRQVIESGILPETISYETNRLSAKSLLLATSRMLAEHGYMRDCSTRSDATWRRDKEDRDA